MKRYDNFVKMCSIAKGGHWCFFPNPFLILVLKGPSSMEAVFSTQDGAKLCYTSFWDKFGIDSIHFGMHPKKTNPFLIPVPKGSSSMEAVFSAQDGLETKSAEDKLSRSAKILFKHHSEKDQAKYF